jgi:hypothetical protein
VAQLVRAPAFLTRNFCVAQVLDTIKLYPPPGGL